MIARYRFAALNLLKDVKETDLLKLAVYSGCAMVGSTWQSVALKEAGYGTPYSFMIIAIEGLMACALLILLSAFYKKEFLMRRVWRFITWSAALAWGVLSLNGFDLTQMPQIGALLCAVVLTYMTAVCLFADTLKQVQTGDAGMMKLVLFLIVVPGMKIIFMAGGGVLAEMGFVYVSSFLCGTLVLSNLCWSSHRLLHTMALDSVERVWHLFKSPQRVLLISLSAFFNGLNLPVRFILVPLYLYNKTGGSLSKIGGVFALLGAAALLAQIAKKYVVADNFNSYALMLGGIFAYAFVPFVWLVNFDSPTVVVAVLLLAEILSVIWSYGFFVELKRLGGESPTVLNQQWQIANMFICGVACLVLAFVSADLAEHMKTYLAFQFAFMMAYITFFHVNWRFRFSRVPS